MGRIRVTEVEKRELEFVCPACNAPIDSWCTNGDVFKKVLHRARFDVAIEAGRLPLK